MVLCQLTCHLAYAPCKRDLRLCYYVKMHMLFYQNLAISFQDINEIRFTVLTVFIYVIFIATSDSLSTKMNSQTSKYC